jgi:hypothetical protein
VTRPGRYEYARTESRCPGAQANAHRGIPADDEALDSCRPTAATTAQAVRFLDRRDPRVVLSVPAQPRRELDRPRSCASVQRTAPSGSSRRELVLRGQCARRSGPDGDPASPLTVGRPRGARLRAGPACTTQTHPTVGRDEQAAWARAAEA